MTKSVNKDFMLNKNEKDTLKLFFEIVENLKTFEIIRSSKYLGDIAEHICEKFYPIELSKNQKEKGFDAIDKNNGKIYQIKINNSAQKTNQIVGNKSSYNILLLLVTKNSLLFNSSDKNVFIAIYNIPSKSITGNYIAKTFLNKLSPDKLLDSNFDLLK